MTRAIPLLDLNAFSSGDAGLKPQFVRDFGNAFHYTGFAGIINHGISGDLIEEFYKASKAFFSLPESEKRKYEIPGLAGQRGYTSFGKEHAKQSPVGDLKEFFQIGQEVTDGDPIKADYPANVMVSNPAEFTQLGIRLYKAFESVGAQLLRAIALYLKLDEHYFDARIHNGNSILRAIHYPPILQDPASAIRAEQHEDINLITLLAGASSGGLQILTKSGHWLDVVPVDNEIVVNVGDMLQRLTNNYLVSTTHRVVNPPRKDWHIPRLSIPFFLHPRMEMDLSCLENCIKPGEYSAYEPITAGNYLDQRLKEIGLKK